MDPVNTTGAILGIIDVVTRSILVLRDLRERYNAVALTVSNLITQLNSLKAALEKISEWISSDLIDVPQHHQLVIDLEEAIVCCRVLVHSVDDQLQKLKHNEQGSFDMPSKIQVVFKTNDFKDFQNFIQRQISALNLLLTACNWYIPI